MKDECWSVLYVPYINSTFNQVQSMHMEVTNPKYFSRFIAIHFNKVCLYRTALM